VYFVTLVVWFATGIWHGASWNFIVWGLLNAVVILLSQECRPLYEKFHAHFPGIQKKYAYRIFQVVRTVLLMSSLRMLDCYRNVGLTFKMFGTMFTDWNMTAAMKGLLQLGLTAARTESGTMRISSYITSFKKCLYIKRFGKTRRFHALNRVL